MEIKNENLVAAFKAADESGKHMLRAMFPEMDWNEKPQDNRHVEERIKTFEDAYDALGEAHPAVILYNYLREELEEGQVPADVAAYIKLRIVVAALNEGWQPEFSPEEERWYPWYYLYTYKELEEEGDEWQQSHTILPIDNYRVVGRSHNSSGAYGGLAYAYASYASSYSHTLHGSRLAFKSEALARYAGKQFIELYADFQLIRK